MSSGYLGLIYVIIGFKSLSHKQKKNSNEKEAKTAFRR